MFDLPTHGWMEHAACAHYETGWWYPPDNTMRSGRRLPAIAVCNQCPVRVQCLQTALDRGEEYGIWGGLTPIQRARLSQSKETPA